MIKLNSKTADFAEKMQMLYQRPGYPPEIEKSVGAIIDDVRARGDRALIDYAEKFDHVTLDPARLRVSDEEIAAAVKSLDNNAKRAIRTALKNVQVFARKRIPKNWKFSPRNGVNLGERFVPMERVGVYIPGGTAPLVSTVIHTAGIAHAAGVREIVAVTPPDRNGKVHPVVLAAMSLAGVTEIYRLGGVYGIAAMAYGTESVPRVEKIVGPGNAYVTAAKKLVYGQVAIDMIAGPSEVMVIADSTANADFIAADLLSQAEHGSGLEQAVLVTTDAKLLDAVETAIESRKKQLKRSETIDRVLEKGTFLILVNSLEEAADIASRYAPEHLELHCDKPSFLAGKIRSCGAIFLGMWTPEPVGDFCAGPSHVLPTAGSGKFFSGLTVEGFFRRMSTIQYTQAAIVREVPFIEKFAEMEGLDAHGMSGSIRLTHSFDE